MANRKRANKPEQKEAGIKFMLTISLVILMLCLLGFAVYEYKTHPDIGDELASVSGQVKSWFGDRKTSIKNGIASVKTLASRKEEPMRPKVHFEFYRKLPAMQMAKPDLETQIKQTLAEKDATDITIAMPTLVKEIAKTEKKAEKKVIVAKKEKKKQKARISQKTRTIISKRKYGRKKPSLRRTAKKKVAKKAAPTKTVVKKRQVASKKSIRKKVAKKVYKKPVVVSRAADLEKDLLATMKKTSGRGKS